jgi:hypothetical protein
MAHNPYKTTHRPIDALIKLNYHSWVTTTLSFREFVHHDPEIYDLSMTTRRRGSL